MFKKTAPIAFGLVSAILAACATHGGSPVSGSNTELLPALAPDLAVRAILPKGTVGENYPSDLGTTRNDHMKGPVGGFTQTERSQTLAFPPGTVIEIRNLSSTTAHTFNEVAQVTHANSAFPQNPALGTSAHGNGVFGAGYASGIIKPHGTVHVKLSNPGVYIIGCAFHYGFGMRDVIVIEKGAKPGPQATPPSTTKPSPTPTHGGGW